MSIELEMKHETEVSTLSAGMYWVQAKLPNGEIEIMSAAYDYGGEYGLYPTKREAFSACEDYLNGASAGMRLMRNQMTVSVKSVTRMRMELSK